MSDNEQQKDSAANADQSPPPQDTAGETIGEAVRVPTLSQPPPRRSTTSTDEKGTGKKKKEKRTPSVIKNQEKGPSGPKPPAVERSDRTPSRDKKKPKADKGPSGPKTPPGEPADDSPRNTQPPPKGSSEPTGTPKNTSVFRIPKIKDARPVRDLKEEAAARLREKNLSAKNYAKETAFPHYELGSHPLNPGLTRRLGRRAEHYKPKPKGPYDPTSQPDQTESSDSTSQISSKGPSGPTRKSSDDHPPQKRGRTNSHASSERSSGAVSRQEERDRHKRGERSRQQSPYGHSTGHRSRADTATGPSGHLKPPQQLHSRSRSQERDTALAAQKQKELTVITKLVDNIEAADKKGKKSAKKPRISKPAPDFTPQLGKLTLRFDQEPSGSNVPNPKVKRSLRTQRTKPYTPIVDANIRKDNMLQTRDEFKRTGKPCPVNFKWYNKRFRDATASYELEFAITHFVDPASIVPLALLPVHAGNPPPTIQECAKDEELYPNEFIRGAIAGNHPAIAFQAIHQVRTVLKGHLASSDIEAYPSLGIYTGLDYDSAASAAYPPWQDTHRMWQEQTKAFEHFVRMALDFLKAKIRRPLCLLLRNKKNSIHKAIPDALEILRLMQVPNNFPFFLTNWSGSPEDAWNWLREYPNTIFGITFDFVTTKTDRENVQFLRELPLSNLVLESGSPKIRCDRQYATSTTCLDTAMLIANKTGEHHRYILEQTAWTAL
ncbi:hypothetical protein AAVH_39846, partial [Aphelenchoides avenae]